MSVYATKFQKSIIIDGKDQSIKIGQELKGDVAKAALEQGWGSKSKPTATVSSKPVPETPEGA